MSVREIFDASANIVCHEILDSAPDREEWDAVLSDGLLVVRSPEGARSLYDLLAKLLRSDRLPKSGRDYLAEKLEAIAQGENPKTVLMPRQCTFRDDALHILKIVKEETEKCGAGHGGLKKVYRNIGNRQRPAVSARTVENKTAKGRQRLRSILGPHVDLVVKELDETRAWRREQNAKREKKVIVSEHVIRLHVARKLKLPPEAVDLIVNHLI